MYIKIIAIAVGVVAIFLGGMFTNYKLQKAPVLNCPTIVIPPCPPCPPALKVQSLDVDKLRKIKGGFTFAPTYTGNIYFTNEKDTMDMRK